MAVARDLMQKHFVGVSRTTKIASALRLATSARVDIMPVVEDTRLYGIVTTAELEKNSQDDSNVEKIMGEPIFVEAGASVEAATGVMVRHGIGRVPVVDDKLTMVCVGMLTSTDIVKASKKS